MYTPQEVRQILKDYPWMLTTIESELMAQEEKSIGVAQYGIEAIMTKGNGKKLDQVCERVLNSHSDSFIKKLARKVKFIDDNENVIENDKDFYILQLLKRGRTHKEIGMLVRLHQSQVSKRIDGIVEKLSNISKKELNA